MAREIYIKKGLDIPLEGKAEGKKPEPVKSELVGICPDDFPGYTWKCDVKPGDSVSKGSPLFHAKEAETIKIVSPVAGTVDEIRRGERRKILAVTVKPEGDSCADITATDLKGKMLETGLWAMMRQRPFDVVPSPDIEPRDIFVTAFDSTPLAGNVIPTHIAEYLEPGLEAIKKLTKGTLYLAVRPGQGLRTKTATVLDMIGPHPAGNPSVQIAAVAPVNKGETVWTIDGGTVARIGMLVKKGVTDYRAEVAITGPSAATPKKVITEIGASMKDVLKGEIKEGEDVRVISGNVLTGLKVDPDSGFLRYPYRQVTMIPEGDQADEFMGWASMNPKKFSVKRSFPAFLRGLDKAFNFDARIKGGHRAMILSGELDKVFPFDIYPEYLIKAMKAGDYDKMEKLGIYEVAPEDFALPEFVDTSKQELQKLTRESLESLRKDS